MNPSNPIIVQSDRTILLEVDHPQHAEAHDALAQFAELDPPVTAMSAAVPTICSPP